ncbi:ABC transporter ATP-binding protein/permease [Ornithinimicrobium faecis]|uniref:ABC transporter ATP-binding protein/permease n=1 Tax=Ornithinimicrobium faecis TaxID=2934158 RepID=A0ABY4YYS7_9MICO|nr:ABC transporter ATP-binding protein [Ornithinimicrobium sp. HY1793]USQ81901.1 ABC transporter ATP-binding protein/permease [Ornithinimicrobium sp. HY1793]
MRLPVWFEAPATPPAIRSVRVDADTTARGLTIRTILASPRHVVPASILTSLHQAGEALVPFIVGRAVDEAVAAADGPALLRWILLLGLTFLGLSMSFRFGSRIGWLGMHSVQHDLRMMVTDRLISPHGTSGRRRSVGADLSVSTADTTILSRSIGLGVYGPSRITAITVCAVILLTVSWPLGVGVLVGSLVVLLLGDLLGGVLRSRVAAQQAAVADAAGSAADLMQGLRIIKGLGAQTVTSGRYRLLSQQSRERAVLTAGAQQRSMAGLSVLGGLFVVGVGGAAGWMALDDQISVGQLITVVMISQFVMEPIAALAQMISFYWNPGVAAAGRVLDVLRTEHAVRDTPAAGPVPDGGAPWGLRLTAPWLPGGVLRVEPGESVVITPDPTVATGLVPLLERTREPGPDEIVELLDGRGSPVLVTDLTVDALRETVLVAPHEPHLFAGSLLGNVLLQEVGEADLEAAVTQTRPALTAASCDDVVATLPDGLASPVGEAGSRLSGGQRQRVGLARVLHAAPQVLVLLDPTTGVDSVTEQRVAAAVTQLRRGRTTVVVTASPAWISHADRVVSPTAGGQR